MSELSFQFPPAFLFIAAAVLVPFLRGKLRAAFTLAVPVLGLIQLLNLAPGPFGKGKEPGKGSGHQGKNIF